MGDLTPELIDTPVWTDEMVARAGIPIVDIPFVTVGGGIGSFAMVDHLRIAGVPANQLAVLGVNDHPWDTYEYLTRVSQVPRGERLRSDAASNPDCIWGFPSYAIREAWKGKKGYVATAQGVKKQSTARGEAGAAVQRADRADPHRLLHATRGPGVREHGA